jgi:hypothetical protein
MEKALWILPPVAFGVYLLLLWGLLRINLSSAVKEGGPKGKGEPYACGEDFPAVKLVPEYGEFYPFAIFFTLIHVAGLMLATLAMAPAPNAIALGGAYLIGVGAVLAILFAR